MTSISRIALALAMALIVVAASTGSASAAYFSPLGSSFTAVSTDATLTDGSLAIKCPTSTITGATTSLPTPTLAVSGGSGMTFGGGCTVLSSGVPVATAVVSTSGTFDFKIVAPNGPTSWTVNVTHDATPAASIAVQVSGRTVCTMAIFTITFTSTETTTTTVSTATTTVTTVNPNTISYVGSGGLCGSGGTAVFSARYEWGSAFRILP